MPPVFCKKCQRVLNEGDTDKNGLCCYCRPTVEVKTEITEEEWKDLGSKA